MTEQLLQKIREESKVEIAGLAEHNEYAKLRNELAIGEEAKRLLGLSYARNMELPEKSETGIIMSIYKKYLCYIHEVDTNGIYVYIGTYMPSELAHEETEDDDSFEIEVDIYDPRATHRRYWNLEGVWAKSIAIQDCEQFERTHTVIYVDDFDNLQKEFIVTAVKESQEKAVRKVRKKYNIDQKR